MNPEIKKKLRIRAVEEGKTVSELAEDYIDKSLADELIKETFLNAPEDEEPLTREEEKSIEEAHKAIIEGKTKSWTRVKRELGI